MDSHLQMEKIWILFANAFLPFANGFYLQMRFCHLQMDSICKCVSELQIDLQMDSICIWVPELQIDLQMVSICKWVSDLQMGSKRYNTMMR